MKQIITKNRTAAIKFTEGGQVNSQRRAFFVEGGKAMIAERIPGEKTAGISVAGGLWWSASKTVNQKLKIPMEK